MKEKLTLESLKLFLKTKLGIFTATAVTAVAVATGVIIVLNLKEDDFRSISVFEVNGDAMVVREEEQIEIYKGMLLTDGDEVSIGNDSSLRLLLDEDKYITLEPNTHIRLFATGNSTDSNTKIELTQGAITNELQNKLSANSSYEVTTPASTMAVRGTMFRVAITQDENGVYQVDLSVFEGSVGTTLIMPDGTSPNGETVITVGTQAEITSDEVITQFVFSDQSMDYNSLPPSVLKYLIELKEDGRLSDLPIKIEELEEILNAMTSPKEKLETSTADLEPKIPETEEASDAPSKPNPPKKLVVEPTSSVTLSTEDTSVFNDSEAKPVPTTVPAPSSNSNSNSNSSSNSNSNSGSDSNSSSGSTPTTPAPSDPAPLNHTVTFNRGRTVYATQIVSDGSSAKKPLLAPTDHFEWYTDFDCNIKYDFSTPVTEDLTLYHK